MRKKIRKSGRTPSHRTIGGKDHKLRLAQERRELSKRRERRKAICAGAGYF